MTWRIEQGDVLDRLREMPDESVQCCVTSPPYWGLRDYGVDGQIGLEASPEEHVAKLVEVFREVRRVLRSDGICWLNYGDAYSGTRAKEPNIRENGTLSYRGGGVGRDAPGLKPKDLIGLPWMLAFGLRADGWWLRSDCIWSKPNPMPESVTDRPTRAHEYVFLLSKSARYYYDAEAIREGATHGNHHRNVFDHRKGLSSESVPPGASLHRGLHRTAGAAAGRNARTVWTINPQPTPEAHFATFPEQLAERCIKAGTSAYGACSDCGAPWMRVVEKGAADLEHQRACGGDADGDYDGSATKDYGAARAQDPSAVKARILAGMRERATTGWKPTCDCRGGGGTHGQTYAARPCVVLDPFAGAGTTLLVAERLGRDSIGIELNPEYVAIAERRIRARDPMAAVEVVPGAVQRSLWGEGA